jgi:dynein light chain LC8-type
MADRSDLNINSNDKVVVKSVDMADEQQEVAIQLAQTSLAKFNTEKDVAANIKKEFDRKYLPNWHCIVGRSFGSYVTHGNLI